MNIIFLTLLDFRSYNDHNIYCDLLREFIKNGINVYCISPIEKRVGIKTHMTEDGHLLKLRIGNIQKTNIIEKGISTIMIEPQFLLAVKKYFANVRFNLVIYSTPPITLGNVIEYIKKRDGAKSYLMLKDIFPQNAVDLGMMSKKGIKGLMYKYFRKKEKKLYDLSDKIGCMSQANVNYVLKNNPEIKEDKVEILPNCIEPVDMRISNVERINLRKKYGLPLDKMIFVYGGNLGKPQDVQFIVKCLKASSEITNAYFLIAGSGTDRHLIEEYIKCEKPRHIKLIEQIPRDEYEMLVACCDVGLIFLDYRFTIPNIPSRLLAYMQAGLPVLACTDVNTDIGDIIVKGRFGWWCESKDVKDFCKNIQMILKTDTCYFGHESYLYLVNNFNVYSVVKTIDLY